MKSFGDTEELKLMKWWQNLLVILLGAGAIGYYCWGQASINRVEMGTAAIEGSLGTPSESRCEYDLRVPMDLDLPQTPAFDTTIVRDNECKRHFLRFPTWGTGTDYLITGNGVERSVGFMHDEKEKQWLDITDLHAGEYHVTLLACGNGGGFTLRIE